MTFSLHFRSGRTIQKGEFLRQTVATASVRHLLRALCTLHRPRHSFNRYVRRLHHRLPGAVEPGQQAEIAQVCSALTCKLSNFITEPG